MRDRIYSLVITRRKKGRKRGNLIHTYRFRISSSRPFREMKADANCEALECLGNHLLNLARTLKPSA